MSYCSVYFSSRSSRLLTLDLAITNIGGTVYCSIVPKKGSYTMTIERIGAVAGSVDVTTRDISQFQQL